ncbi:MAG: 1-(5-phosphoribosyl)-5-[(5-phosphoribosylamino)methylideneamino]imidazole-4-carboxamide isomerase [Anaerolineaceae bacterium]|nr:1-(5-phosphoribosyl)-5-[(5-phosphoribosylamino)methylideneamino]imidazole-4-carboxamide isomerase [Anaerolineaceae bacterium]
MESDFIIFPAIDLRKGQVVRLKEGDPNRQTNYASDPANVAARWLDEGAQWLHVVNLDGAFEETDTTNQEALQSILKVAVARKIPVQFGGGLRSLQDAERILAMGVNRVILGTAAVRRPELVQQAVNRWGAERVAVSLDARDGVVHVRGWQESSNQTAVSLGQTFQTMGLRWIVFTDIARDGLQTGVNLKATLQLAQDTGLQVIASGGVNLIEDVTAIQEAGLPGVIIGRALYEGSIQTEELFKGRKG